MPLKKCMDRHPTTITLKPAGGTCTSPNASVPVRQDTTFADDEPEVLIYYLFSGPADKKPTSFEAECKKLNAQVVMRDTLIDKDHDLLTPETWKPLLQNLKTKCDGALMSPPCGSFSCSRNAEDGGPRPLRGAEGAARYGLSGLDQDEKETVRIGTGCIVRSAEAGQALLDRGPMIAEDGSEVWIPWLIEQPMPREDKPSGLKLDETLALDKHRAVGDSDMVQCHLGARTTKHTTLKGTTKIRSSRVCRHKKKWWRTPWSGRFHWGAHPPLKGTQWAIPAQKWKAWMKRRFPPKGEFLTKQAAQYPGDMNALLAKALVTQARQYKRLSLRTRTSTLSTSSSTTGKLPALREGALLSEPAPSQRVRFAVREGATPEAAAQPERQQLTKCGKWGNVLVSHAMEAKEPRDMTPWNKWNEYSITKGITSELDLKGGNMIQKKKGHLDELHCVGGARNTADSVERLHAVKQYGRQFRAKLDSWISAMPGFEEKCLKLIDISEEKLGEALKDAKYGFDFLLDKFYEFFNVERCDKKDEEFPTSIRAPLLRRGL